MKNILIIGINSLIGNEFFKSYKNSYSIFGTSRRKNNFFYLDLSNNPESWPQFDIIYDCIIFCGSYSSIEECKKNENLSYRINVTSMYDIISKYKKKNTQLIFFSSSHVFDGKKKLYSEDDKTNPKNILGIHKLKGEEIILNEDGLVIRLTKVLDYNFSRFQNWCNYLYKKESIEVFTNLTVSLINLDKVIALLAKVIDNNCKGIIHLSGSDEFSYYDIAKMLAKNLNFDSNLILKSFGDYEITGRINYHTCLKTSRIVNKFGIKTLSTKEVIEDWCNHYKKKLNR